MTSKEKVQNIVRFLNEKKAVGIKVLGISDLTIVSDYFVIVNGTSTTHIKALADEVDFQMGELGEQGRLEGKASDWILIDFGDVIVHIFLPEAREHYNLEKLWADATEVSLEGMVDDE
ncbi:MAG: ribosome silencing factor [Ruminococcaceae bacterium]|nr:ribosome silencing factor [Oscillospiraceae bacterium]